jgi:hypothetical protein
MVALAMFACLALHIAPLPVYDAAEATSHKKDARGRDNPLDALPVVQSELAPVQQPESDQKENLTMNNDDKWVRWGVYVNGGIALATFAIAIFAVLQARAAKLSAQAVINSQRAWVVASPSQLRPPLRFIPEPGDSLEAPGRDKQNFIYVIFKNVGVTPAKILETCALYITIESLNMLPTEPKYSGVETQSGLFLFNRKDQSGRDEAIGRVAPLWPNRILTKEQVQAVRTQKTFLYAYGFVGYEDAFKCKHTMRFGYVYNFPQSGQPPLLGFLPAGPPKYNEAD